MFQAWLPGNLELQNHFSIASTGWLAGIPYLFGIFGSLIAGFVSDYAARRGVGLIASRKAPAIVGLLCVGLFTVLTARTSSSTLAIAAISVTMFFVQTAAAGIWMIPGAVAPHNYVASSASIQNYGGYLGATVSPVLTGFIVDRTGSFEIALVIAAVVAVVGALFSLLGVRSTIELDTLLDEPMAGPVV